MINKIKNLFDNKWDEPTQFAPCLLGSVFIMFVLAALGMLVMIAVKHPAIFFVTISGIVVITSIMVGIAMLIYKIPRWHNRKFVEMEKILYEEKSAETIEYNLYD